MSQVFVFIATQTSADAVLPIYAPSQVEFNRRVANTFRANQGIATVVGDLKLRSVPNPIKGHLLCDGSAVSRRQFTQLFSLIGTTEGPGDGSTTFNLPNYVGVQLAVPAAVPAQPLTASGATVQGYKVSGALNEGESVGGNVPTGAARPKLP